MAECECFNKKVIVKTVYGEAPYLLDLAALTNGNGPENWLDDDDSVDEYTITSPDDIIVSSDSKTLADTAILYWLSGGESLAVYNIVFNVETANHIKEGFIVVIQMC